MSLLEELMGTFERSWKDLTAAYSRLVSPWPLIGVDSVQDVLVLGDIAGTLPTTSSDEEGYAGTARELVTAFRRVIDAVVAGEVPVRGVAVSAELTLLSLQRLAGVPTATPGRFGAVLGRLADLNAAATNAFGFLIDKTFPG